MTIYSPEYYRRKQLIKEAKLPTALELCVQIAMKFDGSYSPGLDKEEADLLIQEIFLKGVIAADNEKKTPPPKKTVEHFYKYECGVCSFVRGSFNKEIYEKLIEVHNKEVHPSCPT